MSDQAWRHPMRPRTPPGGATSGSALRQANPGRPQRQAGSAPSLCKAAQPTRRNTTFLARGPHHRPRASDAFCPRLATTTGTASKRIRHMSPATLRRALPAPLGPIPLTAFSPHRNNFRVRSPALPAPRRAPIAAIWQSVLPNRATLAIQPAGHPRDALPAPLGPIPLTTFPSHRNN